MTTPNLHPQLDLVFPAGDRLSPGAEAVAKQEQQTDNLATVQQDAGHIATQATKPELPANIREAIDRYRSRPISDEDRLAALQRDRYTRPEAEWFDDIS